MAVYRVRKDCPTIQTAVDEASPGDIILLESGTYHETVMIENKQYIHVESHGNAILDGNFQMCFGFLLRNSVGIQIERLRIIGYVDGIDVIDGSSGSLTDCVILDNDFGIVLNHAAKYQICGNQISNIKETGIYSFDSSDTCIEYNAISNCGLAGIFTGKSSVISHNSVFNNNDAGMLCKGNNHYVICNHVFGNSNYGIIIDSNSQVRRNDIYNNGEDGIHVYGTGNSILRNKICSNGRHGTYISSSGQHHTLRQNTLTDNKQVGIKVESDLNYIQQNKSIDNHLSDMEAAASNYLEGNECKTS